MIDLIRSWQYCKHSVVAVGGFKTVRLSGDSEVSAEVVDISDVVAY